MSTYIFIFIQYAEYIFPYFYKLTQKQPLTRRCFSFVIGANLSVKGGRSKNDYQRMMRRQQF